MKNLMEQLIESNGFLIAYIGSESHKRFADTLSKWDLGMYQQAVLTALLQFSDGSPSQKQLSDFTGIDPRNLVPVLDSLEVRELLKRLPHPNDRRRFAIRLTAKGQSLAVRVRQAADELEENMFAALSSSETTTLHALLLKLYQAIESVKEDKGVESGTNE